MAFTTQYVKLSIGGTIQCVKDFPDIDPHGNPDQIETTTLCDEYHQYIDGLKNYADDLEFTANYDEAIFGTYGTIAEYDSSTTYALNALCRHDGVVYKCNTANTTGAWNSTKWDAVAVVLLLCDSASDITGANGKFTISQCDLSVRLKGAGVGDVLEMVYVIKPKSAIAFAKVA